MKNWHHLNQRYPYLFGPIALLLVLCSCGVEKMVKRPVGGKMAPILANVCYADTVIIDVNPNSTQGNQFTNVCLELTGKTVDRLFNALILADKPNWTTSPDVPIDYRLKFYNKSKLLSAIDFGNNCLVVNNIYFTENSGLLQAYSDTMTRQIMKIKHPNLKW